MLFHSASLFASSVLGAALSESANVFSTTIEPNSYPTVPPTPFPAGLNTNGSIKENLKCIGTYRYNTSASVMSSKVVCPIQNLTGLPTIFSIEYSLFQDNATTSDLGGSLEYKATPSGQKYQLFASSDESLINATFVCSASKFAVISLGWDFVNATLTGASLEKNVNCTRSQLPVQSADSFGLITNSTQKFVKRDGTTPIYRTLPDLGNPNNLMTSYSLSHGSVKTFTDYHITATWTVFRYYFYSSGDWIKITLSTESNSFYSAYLNEYGGSTTASTGQYQTAAHVISTEIRCDNNYYDCDYQLDSNSEEFYDISSMSTSSMSTYSNTCPSGSAAISTGGYLICCGPSFVNQYSAGTNYYICLDNSIPYKQLGPSSPAPPAPAPAPPAALAPRVSKGNPTSYSNSVLLTYFTILLFL